MPNTTGSSPDELLTSEERTSRQAGLEEVHQKIAFGLEQAKRGELFDGEEAIKGILEGISRPSTPVQSPTPSR